MSEKLVPTTHELKIWPEYYQAVAEGRKRFEVRQNDRYFAVGDNLWLREFDPGKGTYTGRHLLAKVTYALFGPAWSLPEGMVVMSISVLEEEFGKRHG